MNKEMRRLHLAIYKDWIIIVCVCVCVCVFEPVMSWHIFL